MEANAALLTYVVADPSAEAQKLPAVALCPQRGTGT